MSRIPNPYGPGDERSQNIMRLVSRVADEGGAAARQALVSGHPNVGAEELVRAIAEELPRFARNDLDAACRLAETAIEISRALAPDSRALARRAQGNVLYLHGKAREALEEYEAATSLFESVREEVETARTMSSAIQCFILIGDYAAAFAAADGAREIFDRHGEHHRRARLELNVGNIYHRRDLFEEALSRYETAYSALIETGDAEATAAALSNIAVCLVALNDYRRAHDTYRRARSYCEEHGMTRLVAQADYNIAYLHFARGDYERALAGLRSTHKLSQEAGDSYHVGLCELDQSEIYLELNRLKEAAAMARSASARFQALGNWYESAKSTVNLAISLSRKGQLASAKKLFAGARAAFRREGNRLWPALVDLYQAVVFLNACEPAKARRLCNRALGALGDSGLTDKVGFGLIVRASAALELAELAAAREDCETALARMDTDQKPLLAYQACFTLGRIEQEDGRTKLARSLYERARNHLETLRAGLQAEELRISFVENRLAVYEKLVELCLSEVPPDARGALAFMEHARARALLDVILGRGFSVGRTDPAEVRLRELLGELSWYEHRIRREELSRSERSRERIRNLRAMAREREEELIPALRDSPSMSPALATASALPVERIQEVLPEDSVLVEVFSVKSYLVACVLSTNSIETVRMGALSRVQKPLRRLRVQLSKLPTEADYAMCLSEPLLQATRTTLATLYREIIAPLRHLLRASHLIIIPHGILHHVPFQALYDQGRYLIDDFTLSYAPSASVYAFGRTTNPPSKSPSSLILGVPDGRALFIRDEVRMLASVLPGAALFEGKAATVDVLREKGRQSRYVHLAAHAEFRSENAMFSSIQLGDRPLSAHELYQLDLPAELVTLSGCGTGRSAVAAGDELLGLVRGFLGAGARSLLVSLWDVHDLTTLLFMRSFYRSLCESRGKAESVRSAVLEVRESHPHPYFWAPFSLVGQPD